MQTPTQPPVAFSLTAPLAAAARATRRTPVATLGPVAVLLLPLLPLAAGTQLVLSSGGSGALQGLLAGAPAGQEGALILRPTAHGWLLLAALAALLVTMLAVIVAAGLTTGAVASAHADDARMQPPGLRVTLGRSSAVWPAMFLAITAQLLVVAVAAIAILVVAMYAGRLRFQLSTVVSVLGLGALLMWLIRGSLWPATALREDLPPVAAIRRSWELTHGSVLRVLAAALGALLTIGVPALIVRLIVKTILSALAGAEVIDWSPITIDLIALIPIPIAVFLTSALWGREVAALQRALAAQPRPPADH